MTDGWSLEWPTEPGQYWFYGWCFRGRDYDAELHFVCVYKTSNSIAYVTNGHWMFKSEKGFGSWMKATLPPMPSSMWLKAQEEVHDKAE